MSDKLPIGRITQLEKAENTKLREVLKLALSAFGECRQCDGSGIDPRDKTSACNMCGGTGIGIESRGLLICDFKPMAEKLLKESEEK